MKLKNKIIFLILSISLMLPLNVFGNQIDVDLNECGLNGVENGIEICSEDHIVYYYRTLDGVLQYRRWNATRGYWIDATWLDVID